MKDNGFEERLERLLDQLKRTENIEFINAYYQANRPHRAQFVRDLTRRWPELFQLLLHDDRFDDAMLPSFAMDVMCGLEEEELALVNIDSCLHDYVVSCEEFLRIIPKDVPRLLQSIDVLGILFTYPVIKRAEKTLLAEIYKQSQYELSFPNISFLFNEFVHTVPEEDLRLRTYTYLLRNSESSLTEYVEKNISAFADVVLNECPILIEDDVSSAHVLINNENVSLKQAQDYCRRFNGVFKHLSQIEKNQLWSQLLDQDKVDDSVDNIADYYKANSSMDRHLIGFINRFPQTFAYLGLTDVLDRSARSFFEDAVKCNDLNNDAYRAIASQLKKYYLFGEFSFTGISDEKIEILIDLRIIQMDSQTLRFMRENYQGAMKPYILKNSEHYAEIMTPALIDIPELKQVMVWEIPDQLKIKLLGNTSRGISVTGWKYSDELVAYILENNFEDGDFWAIAEDYDSRSPEVQNAFFPHAVNRVDGIITDFDNERISERLLDRLLRSDELDSAQAKKLLAKWIRKANGRMRIEQALEYLRLWKQNGFIRILKAISDRLVSISKNEGNRQLLEAFAAIGWVEKYTTDSETATHYRCIPGSNVIAHNLLLNEQMRGQMEQDEAEQDEL